MRFLADEICDFAVVRALREAGHDVKAVADVSPRADDRTVIDASLAESRVLVTEDKDFGRLVYAEGRPSAGVILIRFSAAARQELPAAIVDLARERGDQLAECFVVISPRRTRISRPPQGSSDQIAAGLDAVLLIAFGGPTAPNEIRPFLEIVARGRRIPPERLEEVARHYERMPGGRSPLNELTFAQAKALERELARGGPALPVFVGMRNWHPFLHEALAEMRGKGVKRTLGIILSPLRTEASWDRYQQDVADARAQVPGAAEVVYAPAWFEHTKFIEAVAARTRAAFAEIPEAERAKTPLVFTAHGIPVPMAEKSPYVSDFTSAARAVAGRLGHERWSLAYQSRSGSPREPWLEPEIAAVLKRLGAEGERAAVVVPIGFACDHVEMLYDLDVEARAIATAHGVAMHRAAAVNDHPAFIAMLADLVRAPVGGANRAGMPSSTTLAATPASHSSSASTGQPADTRVSEGMPGPIRPAGTEPTPPRATS